MEKNTAWDQRLKLMFGCLKARLENGLMTSYSACVINTVVVVLDGDVVFVGDSGGILVVRSSKSLAVESD